MPERLYKYRGFNDRTLDMLVSDLVYYADPNTFNDPLDTRPSLVIDVDESELATIIGGLMQQRTQSEMSSAAQILKYRGPKTLEHIERSSRRAAERLIQEISHLTTDPEYESENVRSFLLGRKIEVELLRQYEKGIVSLAERAECPLMWSHYGDQHHGLCIGYSVPQRIAGDVHKVSYGGSRVVEASWVASMLAGDDHARRQVDEAVLLRKADSWSYEREWRLIGTRGLQDSPLELEEVVFGMRCKDSVKYTIVKALQDRERNVEFYEMSEIDGRFHLIKRPLDKDNELFSYFPRRAATPYEAFLDHNVDKLSIDDPK